SDNGQPLGIAIDHLKLIAQRTGVNFKYEVTTQPFAEFLKSIKKHQGSDLTPVLVQNPERDEYLSFTESYLESPLVIFSRQEAGFGWHIADLSGKRVSVLKGSNVQSQLAEQYPEINLVLSASDELALEALATGAADAYIGNLIVASHIIHNRGYGNLHVVAPSTFGNLALSIANRKDWPELTSIIDKALASISEEEKTAIRKKYIALNLPTQGLSAEQVLKRILMVVAVALAIVITFVVWNWSLRRKVKLRTASLSHEIVEHQRAEQKVLDHQQRLQAMVSQLTIVEEQERRRIAMDLHDHVGQNLALSRLQLAAASKAVDDVAIKEQLDELSQTLLFAVKDTSALIFELSSPTLDELGLGAAIREWLDNKIERQHNLTVELVSNIEKDSLDQDQSTFLFRSVRELITNVVKHARAKRVSVLLEQGDNVVRVIVKDNGIGFNPEQVKRSVSANGGLGLFSIEERMIALGGSMVIDSHVHHGTSIVLTVPCGEIKKATTI
ncbi:MAG: transporter substrate-binding domain-containing protein, partial [Deltaproteobacteria bacterium]|nr:transporter substrate-binding domain-containing protein [Deltaproteobacteria bacterium]